MLYYFDISKNIAQDFAIIRKGEYPLYDVRLRIRDMDAGQDVVNRAWGELSAPAQGLAVQWTLPPSVYYRIFFAARNGQWHQDLILKRSGKASCWLAATRVVGRNGREVLFEYLDHEYAAEFGVPIWRE